MGQAIDSTNGVDGARDFQIEASRKKLGRMVREGVKSLRDTEVNLYRSNQNSLVALRVSAIRTEIERLSRGLPLRTDSIVRAVGGGLPAVVPIRRSAPQPAEVAVQ